MSTKFSYSLSVNSSVLRNFNRTKILFFDCFLPRRKPTMQKQKMQMYPTSMALHTVLARLAFKQGDVRDTSR